MAKAKKEKRDKMVEIRERVKLAVDADRDNRTAAMADLKFAHKPGHQWDAGAKKERADRPCYEFNKIRPTIKRVVNDMRANRPSGKVRGTEEGDKPTAEIYEGLIRNIWNASDGDTVIDAAAEYQVGGGMGAWRLVVDYDSDSNFDQEIRVEGIRNPFNLYPDPACHDPLKRDARYWVLLSRLAKSTYEQKYGNVEAVDFEGGDEFDDEADWQEDESVRICEYWYKEPVERTLLQLADGRVVFADDPEFMQTVPQPAVVKTRRVQGSKIRMCIASGDKILEEGEWAGAQFPFIVVYGESLIVDGEHLWFGLTRFAKDAQMAYNQSRTAAIETVALAPQAKWWATAKQAAGLTEQWALAHKENRPFMLFNADPQQPGAPQRMGGPDVPVALIQEAQIASEDVKSTTGIFDASLGKQGNETAGTAIRARQAQAEVVTFNYQDNLSKGVRRTWELLVDLIPKIYDSERAVRILGVDGSEKYVRVNKANPIAGGPMENDLKRGKYDVTVTSGPSFSTMREEAAEVYTQMAKGDPRLMGVAGDLILKSLDYPLSDQIAERYKMLLPPAIQQSLSEGKEMPPEVMQAMARVEQMVQLVQEQAQMLQQDAANVESGKAELTKKAADLAVQAANMKADFDTMSAQLMKREAQFILQKAQAGMDAGSQQVAQDRDALGAQLQAALAGIEQRAAEYMTNAAGIIQQMQASAQPQVIVANQPKRKIARTRRVGADLITEIEEIAA